MTELWLIPIALYSAYFAVMTPIAASYGGDWGGIGAVLIGNTVLLFVILPVASAVFGIRAAQKKQEKIYCFYFALVNLVISLVTLGVFSVAAFIISWISSLPVHIAYYSYLEKRGTEAVSQRKNATLYSHPLTITSPNLLHTLKIQEWKANGRGGASVHYRAGTGLMFKKVGSPSSEGWLSPFEHGNYEIDWGKTYITLRFYSGKGTSQIADDKSTWETLTISI